MTGKRYYVNLQTTRGKFIVHESGNLSLAVGNARRHAFEGRIIKDLVSNALKTKYEGSGEREGAVKDLEQRLNPVKVPLVAGAYG